MDKLGHTVDSPHWTAIENAKEQLRGQAAAGADLLHAHRSRSFLEDGYTSIFDFARHGLRIDTQSTKLILELDRIFCDLPKMRWLLETGEVHWAILAAVADVVDCDTEEAWADLCYRFFFDKALIDFLVKDWRAGRLDLVSTSVDTSSLTPDKALN